MNAVTLHHLDQRIVAAHEPGAPDPADQRVGEGDPTGPVLLGAGPVDDGIQGGLDLPVGSVAAEHATVG